MGEILVALGSFVMFTGALGFYRFKDSFQRFHPATLSSVLGLSLIIVGESLDYGLKTGDWQVRPLLAIALIMVVGPITTHLWCRLQTPPL